MGSKGGLFSTEWTAPIRSPGIIACRSSHAHHISPGILQRDSCSGRPGALRRSSRPTLTEKARLSARPSRATGSVPAGLHPLGQRAERDALLYVPESAAKFA